jgi:protein-glutamine gamma-glutamyltransferase
MNTLGRIKAANKPGPPEHSVLLRVASTGTVAIGIAACAAESELSPIVATVSIVAIVVGNVFSYRRRTRPLPALKIVLAIVAVLAFWRFFFAISAAHGVTNLGAVEGPLAVLFTWIQVTHSFDVPSRRDLAFSLAGSVTLMAAAAAQAIDMSFAPYVVAWLAFALVGFGSMWSSISGAGRPRAGRLLGVAAVLGAVALVCVVALPPPSVSSRLVFPSALGGDVNLGSPAGLEGTSSGATLPVHAGSPSGRIAVGGYLGFAGPLDTAVRGTLSSEVVFRVRADRPTFWVAETFDRWDGQSWTEVTPKKNQWRELDGPSPFGLGLPATTPGSEDIQTFYLVQPGPNLVFHAERAEQVWFPAEHLFVDPDGNIRAGTSMGTGSIYTVVSSVSTPTAGELAEANGPALDAVDQARFTELPHPYPRVAALARRITAHATNTEAKVLALEVWMGRHTRYTTDIPPLPTGADTVDEFLFGNRLGFCEQISTSLAVMLRSLGIPAREATGYVPGAYNPITDLYDVEAKDAHAWVQVWFPGYGWESFDPTASVPNATPSAAATIGRDALGALHRVPAIPVGITLGAAAVAYALWRWRSRRPATPQAAVSDALVRAARHSGLAPSRSESLAGLATRIDAHVPAPPGVPGASAIARVAEDCAFGGRQLSQTMATELVQDARALARRARRRGPGTGPRRGGRLSAALRRPPAPHRTTRRRQVGAGRT